MGIASRTMALTIFRVLVACLVLRVGRRGVCEEREKGLGFWKRFLRGGDLAGMVGWEVGEVGRCGRLWDEGMKEWREPVASGVHRGNWGCMFCGFLGRLGRVCPLFSSSSLSSR